VIFPAVPGPAQARRWLELVGALHGARPAFPGRLEPGVHASCRSPPHERPVQPPRG